MLIAPGAFLWLTFGGQVLTGAPAAGMSMWLGILFALLLCLSTAVAYAEHLSKLYPGAGSSYFFAEQAFLSKKEAYKWARLSKFIVGWASHLYYWVYPGVMVGVTAMIVGYMIGQVDSHFSDGSHFSASIPSPIFMWAFCIFFAFAVSYIAYRGGWSDRRASALPLTRRKSSRCSFSPVWLLPIAPTIPRGAPSGC